MGIVPPDRPPFKAGSDNVRPHPASRPDPVELFRGLVEAIGARKFQQAERIRRELYASGWSVVARPNAFGRGGAKP